jgi:thiol-disulfide isomerase/thioredoxin
MPLKIPPLARTHKLPGWTRKMDYAKKFNDGLTYTDFLNQYGSAQHRDRWAGIHAQVQLSAVQQELLASFGRDMKVLVLAGAWCGDCANQCPIFDHFATATPRIQLRFYDRDDHPDLSEVLSTCGAHRVPSVLFLSEDNYVCGRYGDRTLAKYRDLIAKQLGPACPTGIGGEPQSMLDTVTGEWLEEFERIQWMLRLSGRLRQLHGD